MSAKNNLFELKISLDQSDFLLNLNLKSNQIKEYATDLHSLYIISLDCRTYYVSYGERTYLICLCTLYMQHTVPKSDSFKYNGLLVVK